jgi:hypothetical protein
MMTSKIQAVEDQYVARPEVIAAVAPMVKRKATLGEIEALLGIQFGLVRIAAAYDTLMLEAFDRQTALRG